MNPWRFWPKSPVYRLALVLVAAGTLYVGGRWVYDAIRGPINRDTCDRIQAGMTQDEVAALIGFPGTEPPPQLEFLFLGSLRTRPPGTWLVVWMCQDGCIGV